MAPAILELRDLHKRYGTNVALEKVSLQVYEGELFGLLGPNGAGKTTLLSIISFLLEPTSGEVLLFGKPMRPNDRDARRLIGIVPQELAIYHELTARENLRFFGELYGLRGAALDGRVAAVLDAIGLTDRANDRAATFSGGMKRRLNLGAALVHEPKLVLLDEPTTGVDPQSRNHLFEGVRQLNAAGTTLIYTSHYMEEVQALCPRIGIIDHGKLIACDTLEALLKRLEGLIRFRVPAATPELRQRLDALAGVQVRVPNERTVELSCRDVRRVLVEVLAVLTELQIELTSLETEEPNLERVFLHLTGRGLRD
jgi:ABC-2 type transport system ATP-binding protein